jgi:hypothetical protein
LELPVPARPASFHPPIPNALSQSVRDNGPYQSLNLKCSSPAGAVVSSLAHEGRQSVTFRFYSPLIPLFLNPHPLTHH